MVARSRSGGRSVRRRNRDLLIGIGIASGLALFFGAGLYRFVRFSQGGDQALLPTPSSAPSSPATASTLLGAVPEQKLFAMRQRVSLGDQEPVPSQGAQSTPDSPPGLEASGPEETGDEPASKDVRELLRRARRQVNSGKREQALDTARQIAANLPDSDRRQQLAERVDDAEAAAGAGQLVDFDSLIQLIEQTIAPTTWSSVGGAGTIDSFAGGVYVDTAGLIRRRPVQTSSQELARARQEARSSDESETPHDSSLRKVSLPRLEREVARRISSGQPLDEEMRYLAGLQEIRFVLAFPEDHDLVIVGPAEAWRTDAAGRVVGERSGHPVLQLDDLAAILRTCFANAQNPGFFGCGIFPRTERLQQVQEYLARSSAAGPINPAHRDRWLADLRDQLGQQDVKIFGIHPGSRVAHVLVEADYRMKLIGIGLEPAAVPRIPSYFDLLGQPDDARLQRPIDTLRWWFTLNYDSITSNETLDAFGLSGARVKVLSENELLTATGQRLHTGQSDPVNAQFAKNFSDQFPALADHDVNFADLAGIFDLSIVGGLMSGYQLPEAIGWQMTTLLDPDDYVIPLNPAPKSVETVMNHRVYRGRHIMAAISGGVHVDPKPLVARDRLVPDTDGSLQSLRTSSRPINQGSPRWWWD